MLAPLLVLLMQPAALAVSFDVVVDSSGDIPHGKVYVVTANKRTLVKKVVGGGQALTERPDWAPTHALAYMSTWYAGQGDQFYAVRKGSSYRVYHREVSEESDPTRFKMIKSVSVGRARPSKTRRPDPPNNPSARTIE